MALENDFLAMASTTVTLAKESTVGDYGEPTYASGTAYTARVEPRVRMVTGPDGDEVRSSATVYVMSSSADVSVSDKMTLPSGREPRLLSVEPVRDDEGQHHVEVAVS